MTKNLEVVQVLISFRKMAKEAIKLLSFSKYSCSVLDNTRPNPGHWKCQLYAATDLKVLKMAWGSLWKVLEEPSELSHLTAHLTFTRDWIALGIGHRIQKSVSDRAMPEEGLDY